ncbi:trypsin-like serine protease [Streptomyces sp. NPDC004728]|uniref:trypsin-like serine protease n=1 Tax=Streptomyces sp. NPDC004728 TaxID=3154289 RepID=UPI0033BB79D5
MALRLGSRHPAHRPDGPGLAGHLRLRRARDDHRRRRRPGPGGTFYPVQEYRLHKNYNGGAAVPNNIAVLKLATPIAYTPQVQPIALPDLLGGTATLTGWGRLNGGDARNPAALPRDLSSKRSVRIPLTSGPPPTMPAATMVDMTRSCA